MSESVGGNEPRLNAIADKVQRECVCIMWRGNITGNVVTCGSCRYCLLAERLRA